MEIISYIWTQYLHIPLYNLLIWIYNNYTDYSLTVAVVLLTIGLRVILLPLSIVEERRKTKKTKLDEELEQIAKDYSTDQIKRREQIRLFLQRNHIRPWAKAVSLTIQGVILVILYKVFVAGISSEASLHLLYPSIQRPDFINTDFLGFDIGVPNLYFPAAVAAYLFAESLIEYWLHKKNDEVGKNEQLFIILFPAFSFLILAILPSVKSIFILTSLVFSTIISMISGAIHMATQSPKKQQHH